MLAAITRKASPALQASSSSFIESHRPANTNMSSQTLLAKLGAHVISLPEEPQLADSMFVEDTAIVLDEVAVICPMGTGSRRKELPTIAAALEKYRRLAHVKLPGTLEGGDVLLVGRKVFVGLAARRTRRAFAN